MTTLNTSIYEKAISQFDDPLINDAYNNNSILFFKVMYNFMVNAIPLMINPSTLIITLNDRVDPDGEIELFDGDGTTVDFILTTTPTTNAYFSYKVDDEYVDGTFNSVTNKVTLDYAPDTGTENVAIEWYDPGYFNTTLTIQVQNILACFLVSCWAEKEKNFLLDIRRLLNDNQFKLDNAANNMKEKGNWYYSMREKAEKLMGQNAWISWQDTIKTKYGLS